MKIAASYTLKVMSNKFGIGQTGLGSVCTALRCDVTRPHATHSPQVYIRCQRSDESGAVHLWHYGELGARTGG
jgi:hypothetical protein